MSFNFIFHFCYVFHVFLPQQTGGRVWVFFFSLIDQTFGKVFHKGRKNTGLQALRVRTHAVWQVLRKQTNSFAGSTGTTEYSFAGSLTLNGWEDIAWYLSWKSNAEIQFHMLRYVAGRGRNRGRCYLQASQARPRQRPCSGVCKSPV